jgi:hypothetical protein
MSNWEIFPSQCLGISLNRLSTAIKQPRAWAWDVGVWGLHEQYGVGRK